MRCVVRLPRTIFFYLFLWLCFSYAKRRKEKLEAVIIANNFGVLVTVFAAVCYFACLLFSVLFFFFYFAVDICFTLAPSAYVHLSVVEIAGVCVACIFA